jgi:heterodisulfide reductase subunit A-like polyferredoxin
MLVELSVMLKPKLNIVDAVIGMEGNGPGSGDPRQIGLILAGQDPVSLDVVSGVILGLSPLQVPVIRAARETGAGESRLEGISILGAPISEVKIKDFILPQQMNTEWPIPELARRCLKNALTTRPVINHDVCIRCGICQDDCPRSAITERDGEMIIDYRNCIRCFCCQEFCPKGAITVGKGWMLWIMG